MIIKKIFSILLSMKLMTLLLLIFATSIGIATFIESAYGPNASKTVVYNSLWFELILVVLGINLIANIFRYKLLRVSKIPVLMFHLAFIVILIGATITRYISYEGTLRIREGEENNALISADSYLRFMVSKKDDPKGKWFNQKMLLNPYKNRKFSKQLSYDSKDIKVSLIGYMHNAVDQVVEDENGDQIIELVVLNDGKGDTVFLKRNHSILLNNQIIGFENDPKAASIYLYSTDSGIVIEPKIDLSYMKMLDQSTGDVKAESSVLFARRRLYSFGENKMVFKSLHKKAILKKINLDPTIKKGDELLTIQVAVDGVKDTVLLSGNKGVVSTPIVQDINGLECTLSYGAYYQMLPFSIYLKDFQLERYPGSNSPSSFASEVKLIDRRDGYEQDFRIYMNHILDYDGYRFFQSSYDPDELGTILSVNHDYWGTLISYLGYGLMALGMILTLFSRKSRYFSLFDKLRKMKLRKHFTVIFVLFSINLSTTFAQQTPKEPIIFPEKFIEKFESLIIQDNSGRMKPIGVFSAELIRKIAKKKNLKVSINGEERTFSPTEIIAGMIFDPMFWQQIPMIKVKHNELEKELKCVNKLVAFNSMFGQKFNYVLSQKIDAISRKKPVDQSKYEQEIIKVDERLSICYMVYTSNLLKIFPNPYKENNEWNSPIDYKSFQKDSNNIKMLYGLLLENTINASKDKDWDKAIRTIELLNKYQQKQGKKVYPSARKIQLELWYEKAGIFVSLYKYYILIALLLIIFIITSAISKLNWPKYPIYICMGLFVLTFLYHTFGLGVRWYISGHAPWSNGHEAMLYIAWTMALSGLLFSRRIQLPLAASAIVAAMTLFVAHASFMDPEITPLVPVLKSYWLMIHVATITAGYGFLSLGAILGLINLIIMTIQTQKNKFKIQDTIKELTIVNEMTVTIGLFLTTIGTFLGGIWANESWGRYWGWDPKETWALVIVVVYAMVLHFRFIPKMNSRYIFNLSSLLSFGTVLMTYFGVNYYLTGLHSYAGGGTPPPFPMWAYYTLIGIFIVSLLAFWRNKIVNKK